MRRALFPRLILFVILSTALASCSVERGAIHARIRIATEAAYPPFEMVDEKSEELVGFDIDLMNAIAKKEGFEVEYQDTSFDALTAGIETCRFDAAISAITINDKDRQKMAFSNPYFDAGQVIAVRAENTSIQSSDDLKGKKIGVTMGTPGEVEARKIDGASIRDFNTVDQAFQELVNGQLDAVIADNPTTLIFVSRFTGRIKTAGGPITDEQYRIAICKKNADLQMKINDGLAALAKDGTLQRLQDKWLSAAPPD